MTQARQREAWNHTASLLAMLANVHRDPRKGRGFQPSDFHPMPVTKHRDAPILKGDIGMLKSTFLPPPPSNPPS